MENNTTSHQVRSQLITALQLDLIGPTPEDIDHQEEILDQAPSKWYLSGFLVPSGAPLEQRIDDTVNEDLDLMEGGSTAEDENVPEKPFAQKAFFPSSMGLSFLVPQNASQLNITVQWGDYFPIKDDHHPEVETSYTQLDILSPPDKIDQTPPDKSGQNLSGQNLSGQNLSGCWKRIPKQAYLTIPLPDHPPGQDKITYSVPDSDGLKLVISIRNVGYQELIPEGTYSVSVFLVNNRLVTVDKQRDISYTFQTTLIINTPEPLVPRPNLRGRDDNDWDENVADLQYRDDYEYAVGHNVSAISLTNSDGDCHNIQTAWIPTADVEKVIASPVDKVELGMEALAKASTPEALQNMLTPMSDAYAGWIENQRHQCPTDSDRLGLTTAKRLTVAQKLLDRAEVANQRIKAGITALQDPEIFTAFSIANRTIARYIRQRVTHGKDITPESVEAPKWRPFQLGFLLMNLTGIADPETGDRELVDLLFFPTGGGKTEAYLGLAAFTLVLRRLRYPGIKSAGLSVLMRYTLRLLTLDQLGRAAAMICALEIERQNNPQQLGTWPFEIGLWVGQGSTPNRMGKKGETDDYSARKRTLDFQKDDGKPSPIPLESCPWCGTKFNRNSFQLYPNPDHPTNLRVSCANRRCHFSRNQALPIVAVDEPIYRRLPCFMISTVDKFASLPWVGETGALFGKVDRYDDDGFYGPTQPKGGKTLGGHLPPPDLIIQDELHLISGPLGTMVGLYETAIDALCTQEINGKKIRPKIVASTATVRRAHQQIQALFGRSEVDIFPPPGPDRRDSFFAKTVSPTVKNPRIYVGIAAQGRSLKVVLLRTYLALLSAAQKHWLELGGKKNPHNPADPYMTLLGYFNSVRELGGSRRIIEDEVKSRLLTYSQRLRINETTGLFADRKIADEIEELTSRVNTSQVAETKRHLESTFTQADKVDVVLATNMISVGLDITRLGLMVVLGQPKTAAEYIQATSRVGRDEERPGLVVTLLNIHRPRDRSHYERFAAWHSTFYRAVEATSVTPFSPRAIDRGIAAITVALARLGHPKMTPPMGAFDIAQHRDQLQFVIDTIAQRAQMQETEPSQAQAQGEKVESRVKDLLDSWETIANNKTNLQYQREVGAAPPLLFDTLDPELDKQSSAAQKFKAQRSLRDVEPTVNIWVINPEKIEE
ncbi:DISARM system helicase DrmA [Anabaenopsis tanganyikae CS-531]|uniref:DISARM system helicase DrmA n=1 Tax=Anabaenopsis tanganyikae CS-531 TaxID=2785304 RepID=A0ABT6KDQ7_9CYAN|nr:DISARM system helicase DrmA [Anabaenopsis tanganyikae]MDH6106002.1 DISARM system helicase DrmA [Anabaenopsis tanganyikae CS-531]